MAGRTARVDGKGRITLGSAWIGKTFMVDLDEAGRVVLTPVAQIPERELWLHQNPTALQLVHQGLHEAAEGEAEDADSFSKYADVEID